MKNSINDLSKNLREPKNYELIKLEDKIIFQDLGIKKLGNIFKHDNGWSVDTDLHPQIDVKNHVIYLRGSEKEKDNYITVIDCEDNEARDVLFNIILETLNEYEIQCYWEEYISNK